MYFCTPRPRRWPPPRTAGKPLLLTTEPVVVEPAPEVQRSSFDLPRSIRLLRAVPRLRRTPHAGVRFPLERNRT